jgi:hypothetical protein
MEQGSRAAVVGDVVGAEVSGAVLSQIDLDAYVRALYGDHAASPCPFTPGEVAELARTNEMLVYVPKALTADQMCRMWGFRSNVDFGADKLIRYTMTTEDHWFVTSSAKTPEMIYRSGVVAKRQFEDEGLHGMDVRRYLAFSATYRLRFGVLPDQIYWTFLLGGAYDRSGVSIIGFDAHGVLNHHGWMKDFKAKFVGSRYAVLAPRLEVTPETEALPRAYRGGGRAGREADMD